MTTDLQATEKAATDAKRAHAAEAECERLRAALRRAEADRDLYASQLLDASGGRLSTACDLVQDILDAHAVVSITSLSEDEWVLELQQKVADGERERFSGRYLFDAIWKMQEAGKVR